MAAPNDENDLAGIGVFARIRPQAKRQDSVDEARGRPSKGKAAVAADSEPPPIIVHGKDTGVQKTLQVRNLQFSLDWCFDSDSTQEELYNIVARQRVARVLKGYNVCFLVYGQTGAGKTFSMFGPDEVLHNFTASDKALHGIAPRAIKDLFEAYTPGKQVAHVSYVEVYNDQLNDLLAQKKNLKIGETPQKKVIVQGLSKEVVTTAEQSMQHLIRGNGFRVTAAMKMNPRSSRSHAIFVLQLSEVGSQAECGRLTLVDLAGMESSEKSPPMEAGSASSAAPRREEAKNINQSLYALGTVIERLSASKNGLHIPYRDSKLTRLLQESLGGNCAAAIVVALRAEQENLDEQIGTLRFAQRAKAVPVVIKAAPAVQKAAISSRLEAELEASKAELETCNQLIENLRKEIRERDEFNLDGHVTNIVESLEAGEEVQRIAQLEVECLQLRNRNRTLRVASILQKLVEQGRKEKILEQEAELVETRRLALEGAGAAAAAGDDIEEIQTTLTTEAMAGCFEIQVVSSDGFRIGDQISIGDEANIVAGFGSILLFSPLAGDYPPGTVVSVRRAGVPSPSAARQSLGEDGMRSPLRPEPLTLGSPSPGSTAKGAATDAAWVAAAPPGLGDEGAPLNSDPPLEPSRCEHVAMTCAVAVCYVVPFFAEWFFGPEAFDQDNDGDFDMHDVRIVLRRWGCISQAFFDSAARADKEEAERQRQQAIEEAKMRRAESTDTDCSGFADLLEDGVEGFVDLLESDVEGLKSNGKGGIKSQETKVLRDLQSGRRFPWFILIQCLICFMLWLIFAVSVSSKEQSDLVTTQAGLDSLSERMFDLRLTGPSCEDYRGQAWRWLTYQFTHVGCAHVLMNSFMCVMIGIPLEGAHGTLRMFLMFNVGVFGGACNYFAADAHGGVVGMSGGCYALLGVSLADLIMNWKQKRYRKPTVLLLAVLVAFDLVTYAITSSEQTSHAAHFGGFVAGLMIGIVLVENLVVTGLEKKLFIGSLSVGAVLVVFCLCWLFTHWGPRNVFEAVGGTDTNFCWLRQVYNPSIDQDSWICIGCRCSDTACQSQWGASSYIQEVDRSVCGDTLEWHISNSTIKC